MKTNILIEQKLKKIQKLKNHNFLKKMNPHQFKMSIFLAANLCLINHQVLKNQIYNKLMNSLLIMMNTQNY